MKRVFIVFSLLFSFYSMANVLELNKGQSLRVKVSGCESYEQETLEVQKGILKGGCKPAECRAVYDTDTEVYKVYRYENGECGRNRCGEGAEFVGEFTPTINGILHAIVNIGKIKKSHAADFQRFIDSTSRCGVIKKFGSDISGDDEFTRSL